MPAASEEKLVLLAGELQPRGVQRLLYGTGDHLPALPKKARTGRGWPFEALPASGQDGAQA